jgi:4-amino-4-deoxy-L-arabinose transferase-like glycosyltransferase
MADPDAPKTKSVQKASDSTAKKRGWDDEREETAEETAQEPTPPKKAKPKTNGGEGETVEARKKLPPPPEDDDRAPESEGEAKAKTGDKSDKGPSPIAFLFGGNRLSLKRGGILLAIGGLGAFLLMARDGQWRWGVPVGFVLVLIAITGGLDMVGSFGDLIPWRIGDPKVDKGATTLPPARISDREYPASAAMVPGALTIVSLLTAMTLMSYAVGIGWGIAITISWIATAAFGFKTLAAIGVVDEGDRPLLKRHGFWLIVFCCVLYLPTLGAHSLVDPWETHYGEVSRDVLARDDWITIWWAEEGYFLSKPILDFWMQALAMATFGVHYLPDGMIAPKNIGGEPTHPEWVVRLPSLTLSVIAIYLAYRAVSHVRGRRAGVIAGLVMATMGDWMMLSHQSITDMPFVASLTAAMSLLIIGLTTDDSETVRATRVRIFGTTISISGYQLALGIVLVCALPQALYLLSRNFEFVTQNTLGFAPHADEYRTGNGRLCWMPPNTGDGFERLMRIGKWPCDLGKLAHPHFYPALQGLLWMTALGILLAINRNERRISRLCFIVAWVFAGISTMGKGVAGIFLPIAVAGCYIVTARKWRDVLRLELISGALVILTVAAPWFIAMYGRMGDEFIQQLFVHHMWKRALDHVHDTNTGDDVSIRYYVWQLGYAMFPWTGLVPAGLVWWARNRWGQAKKILTLQEQKQRDVAIFLVMWFVFAWALFTYMKTKFHHYVFPAVPAAAMLTGIFLDDAIGPRKLTAKNVIAWIGTTVAGVALMAYGLSRLVPGKFNGYVSLPNPEKMSYLDVAKYIADTYPAAPVIGIVIALAGLLLAIGAQRFLDSEPKVTPPKANAKDYRALEPVKTPSASTLDAVRSRSIMIGGLALAAAITTALVARDLVSRPDNDIKGQERLIQLYTYRYDRVWPKELAFQPALLGFGLAATVLVLVLVARAYRRQAIIAMTALAALFAAWTLDDYMMYVAPHWGQRPLFEAYYRDRHSVREPLVAFEMNWKGENFYSGGRLVEFGNGMSQGATAGERGSDRMRQWLTDMRNKTGAVYFVTENSRVGKIDEMLRGVLGNPPNGAPRWTEPITNDTITNKFVIVRARWGS